METAALFALGRVRDLSVASAVVLDPVANQEASARDVELHKAAGDLRRVLSATVQFLVSDS